MNGQTDSLALLLVVIWPLLLVLAVAFAATRTVALRLVPWAALPALAVVAVLADCALGFPGVLLGSALVLDNTGRVFLMAGASLWLATGLLAIPRLKSDDTGRYAILLLLAMAGCFGTTLAHDALTFFSAATLASYALYGLLVCEPDASAQKAGRWLVVFLVAGDLVVFELLLLLAQAAGSVDFASMRQAFMISDTRALMLGLLIVGFGIKAGVVGFHFWLAPVLLSATPVVRPALVGFMLCAGLLGWLRLLPTPQTPWSAAGSIVQWLVWITLGYTVIAGLLQTRSRSILASAATALTGLWLGALGAALLHPQVWNGMNDAVHVAVLQSGFALAALLLFDRGAGGSVPAWLRHLCHVFMWLAVLLLASAPIVIAGLLAKIDAMAALQLFSLSAAMAFLAVRSLLRVVPAFHVSQHGRTSPDVVLRCGGSIVALLTAGGLILAAMLAAAYGMDMLSSVEIRRAAMMLSAAAVAAWLYDAWLVPCLPAFTRGGLLVAFNNWLALTINYARRLLDTRLPHWCDAGLAHTWQLRSGVDWRRMAERLESRLSRWSTVLVLLMMVGLIVAWWSGSR